MENVHGLVVLLHPVAAVTIVDSHEHKKETQPRVIGTVLGGREKGVVEVRSRIWTTPDREYYRLQRTHTRCYYFCISIFICTRTKLAGF